MPGLKPIVEGIDTVLLLNNSIAANLLFSVSDPDGDPITEYIFKDSPGASSGFFIFKGVVQGNGIQLTVSASDLDELFYVAGPAVNNEFITIQASDGTLLSDPALVKLYTARQESVRPVVQVDAATVLGNEFIFAKDFITAFDPDGFPIVSYSIRDRNIDQSFFSLDGAPIQQGVFVTFTADEFDRLVYNGFGRKTESVDVFAFDGTVSSLMGTNLVETLANLNRPVVDFGSAMTVQDQLFELGSIVDFNDADGNTIKWIEFRDRNDKPFSGSLFFQGQELAAKQFHQFTLDQLDQVFFIGGERNITEEVRYRVSDGRFRSTTGSLELQNVASGANSAQPRLLADNLVNSVREQLEIVPLVDLVSQVGSGLPITSYEVIDTNTNPISATLFLGNTPLTPGVVHTVTAAQYLNQLRVRTGTFDDRRLDQIFVRGTNGSLVSDWTRLNLHTEPEFFEAFTGLDPNGFVVPTWDLVYQFLAMPTDPIDITYSFMQQLPDYFTGEAVEEPFRMPSPRLFLQFTEAQKAAVRQAFAAIESFANIRFVEVVDSPLTVDPVSGNRGGTIRFGNYYRADDRPMIDTMPDDSVICSQSFFPGLDPEDGDIWFNVDLTPFGLPASPCGNNGLDYFFSPDVGPGTFEYDFLLPNIAFALGQRPPFDLIGPGDQNPILPDPTQIDAFTVYGASSPDPLTGFSLYDVNFFQTAYGTNNNFNTGNDIYSTATLINGGNARQAIWDAGGIDTISAVGSTIDDVVIDLRPGAFSSIGNLNSNISIAFRAQIENAVGSDGDDDLRGNELNNRISGGNGNDTIRGFGGNDTLLGGAGGDLYVFSVADGDNRVNEEKLAGRDTIQFLEFPSFNDFTEDFTFRLDGRDLVIQLTLNNGPADTVVTITDQTRGASRLESLVFGTSTIDLVNLTDQATGANQKFQITPESTIFGNLVTPV